MGRGVVAAYCGHDKISLHRGALVALQEHYKRNRYPGMKVCLASSATTPFAVQIGRATLKLLEVVPGVSVWDVIMRDWDGQDVNQIGREPPLSRYVEGRDVSIGVCMQNVCTYNIRSQVRDSSNKARTHFPLIRELTGIPYDRMLFFDDWYVHAASQRVTTH